MEKSRIAALVDGIFAVAMTLLVLDLKLSYDHLTPSWIASVRLRTGIPAIIAAMSMAISFFNPPLALNAYWLMLVFHFLPGWHDRPPALND